MRCVVCHAHDDRLEDQIFLRAFEVSFQFVQLMCWQSLNLIENCFLLI